MKKQALGWVGVMSLLLAAGSALAQTGAMRADVPFSFTINDTAMPAGTYTISRADSSSNTLVIRGGDSAAVKIVIPHRVQSLNAADRTKLVFHCYSGRDHCFLYQLWVGGERAGQELRKSSLEKEVATARQRSEDVPVIASSR